MILKIKTNTRIDIQKLIEIYIIEKSMIEIEWNQDRTISILFHLIEIAYIESIFLLIFLELIFGIDIRKISHEFVDI